jgi:hypothetical protein
MRPIEALQLSLNSQVAPFSVSERRASRYNSGINRRAPKRMKREWMVYPVWNQQRPQSLSPLQGASRAASRPALQGGSSASGDHSHQSPVHRASRCSALALPPLRWLKPNPEKPGEPGSRESRPRRPALKGGPRRCAKSPLKGAAGQLGDLKGATGQLGDLKGAAEQLGDLKGATGQFDNVSIVSSFF